MIDRVAFPVFPFFSNAFCRGCLSNVRDIPAANWAVFGICYNSGQDCTAGSRLYVQDTVYDKFVELLVSKAKQQVIGDGLDDKSAGGPLVRSPPFQPHIYDLINDAQVSKRQYDRVWGYIESGKQEGAKAVLGGVKRPGKGFYADPTSESMYSLIAAGEHLSYRLDAVFTEIRSDMKIVRTDSLETVIFVADPLGLSQ
jgi:aldehyde dehydrogenase (NAD+)